MDILYSQESYCALCDLYFPSNKERASHIQDPQYNHPSCDVCFRRFLNRNTLRNHYIYSKRHHYCASCEITFETAAGLRIHIEYAAVHNDDSSSEGEDDDEFPGEDYSEGWEERLGTRKYPDEESDVGEDEFTPQEFEEFDECDFFETVEELAAPPEAEEDQTYESDIEYCSEPSCLVCQRKPDIVCASECGHCFCAPCTTQVPKLTKTLDCPLCGQEDALLSERLRKVFLAATTD